MHMGKKDKRNTTLYRERDYGQGKNKKHWETGKEKTGWIFSVGYLVLLFHIGYLVYRYAYAAQNLMKYVQNNHPAYLLFASLMPFGWWILSTIDDYWHFHRRKLRMLHLCALNAGLVWMQLIWTSSWRMLVQKVVRINPGRNFTTDMVIELAKNALIAPCLLFLYLMLREYHEKALHPLNRPKIQGFRLQHILDFRKNKQSLYDLRIMKDLTIDSKK